jgi:hypothetical protein
VWGKYAVIKDQVDWRPRDEGGKAREKVQRFEDEVARAIRQAVFSARISAAPFHSRALMAMPAASSPGFMRNVAGKLVTRQVLDVARSGSSTI